MKELPTTKIFLIRHGQSEWNGTKRISGQLDPPLSKKGMKQARTLEKAIRSEKLSAIYTSTLQRSIETARPTAEHHRISVQKKEAFMEIHLGILQGRFRDQRDPEAQRLWIARSADRLTYRIPGGETFSELEQRVAPCINEILQKEAGGVVLIVGHRNTNRAILGVLMRWLSDSVVGLKLSSKYLYEITLGDDPSIKTLSLDENLKYDGFKV
ncbi:MAG: histidine phosphatase family protein [Candidatus Manganitrophus sp. SA1]|nr:histidine phosphatase family protein [Candidatus Manganitrophus morganii]